MNEPSGSAQCQICHQTAHGVHFGVASCRACAAFFRRSTVLDKKYTCRRADSKCNVEKWARDSCRYCRLQKCKSLGMTEDNVQRNRDTQKPIVIVTPGFKVKTAPRPLFDMSGMLDEITKIFENFVIPKVYMSKNSLEKMDFALQKHRKHQKMEGIEFLPSLNFSELVSKWGDNCQVAYWMMHSEEFRSLHSNNKLAVFNSTWMLWQRLERLTMTLDIFGQRAIDEKIMLMSDTHAIYMDQVKFDASMMSDHDAERIKDMFEPLSRRMFDEVAKPLLEIKPTSIEVAFMLCQIFWNSAGKKFQGEILSAGEKFLDEIANDLHVYYVKQRRTPKYANRLARMMGAVQAMQRNQEERQQMFELARLFDVFKVKLSDPIDVLKG